MPALKTILKHHRFKAELLFQKPNRSAWEFMLEVDDTLVGISDPLGLGHNPERRQKLAANKEAYIVVVSFCGLTKSSPTSLHFKGQYPVEFAL